jgi:hypothetical protein
MAGFEVSTEGYLEAVLQSAEAIDDPKLRRLDRLLLGLFLAGVLFTGAIAVTSGVSRLREEDAMTRQTKEIPRAPEQRSLNGIGRLQGGGGTSANQSGASTTTTQGNDAGGKAGSEGETGKKP